MSNSSLPFRNSSLRVFSACLLSFLLIMMPFVQMAAASKRSEVRGQRSERGNSTTVKEGSVTTPAAATENVFLNAPIPKPAPEPPALLVPTITASMPDTIVNDDGDSKIDPFNGNLGTTEKIQYTATISNSGTNATNVVFSDQLDAHTTLIPDSPVAAVSDSYNTIGNTQISVLDGATDLLGNDFDPDNGNSNAGMTVSSYGATTGTEVTPATATPTAQGGSVTVNANGSFTYDPPLGFEGTDTFKYAANDSGFTAITTVNITIAGMIWYVNNNAGACPGAPCDGRLSHPFQTLAAFQAVNNGTGNNPAAGDNIFLFESAIDYVGPVTLLNNQRLIGQDATESLTTITGLTPPSGSDPFPTMDPNNGTIVNITSTAAAANAINLGQGNNLRGFTAGNVGAGGSAIAGTDFGTLSVGGSAPGDVSVNSNGQALKLAKSGAGGSGTLNGNFKAVSSSGGANGIQFTGILGTVAIAGGTLTGATSDEFLIEGHTPSINVTFSGNITYAGAGSAIRVTASTGIHTGNLTFDTGTLSVTGGTGVNIITQSGTCNFYTTTGSANINGAGNGVILDVNSNGAYNFGQDGTPTSFTITNTTGTSFTVSNTAADVTYNGNISQTANNATLVSMTSLNSAGFVTFDNNGTLSATNGNGIQLTDADGPVSFNGTTTLNGGDAGVDITNGSNGTISFSSNASIGSTSAGPAFNVSGTPAVSGNITYSGSITENDAQRVVNVDGLTGIVTFNTGTITGGASSTGVNINNTNGNVTFSNGLILGTSGSRMTNQAVTMTNGAGTGAGTYSLGAVSIFTNGAAGIVATGIDGTINNSSGTVDSTGATAINIDGPAGLTTLGMTLTTVNSTGGANNVTLTDVGGSIAMNGGALSGASGVSVNVLNSTSNITLAASISKTSAGRLVDFDNYDTGTATISGSLTCNTSCDGVEVTNNAVSSGTVNFSGGTKTLNTGADTAVNLDNNDGGQVNFTNGGLDIDTTSGMGFNAINGGTVTVTTGANNNTIDTTTGIGMNVTNTNIGLNNLTFRSISVNGASSGIVLTSTGTTASFGGLTVTGDGTGAENGSGGLITATTSFGINLSNTRDVSLTQLRITNTLNHGINASSVTNFTYQDASIVNAADGNDEQGMNLLNIFGTSLIEDVRLDDIQEDGIQIRQNIDPDSNNTTFDTLTIRRLDVEDHQAGFGEAGIEAQVDLSSSLAVVVDDSDFAINTNAIMGVAMSTAASFTSTGRFKFTVQNSTFDGSNAFGSGAIQALGGGQGTSTFLVTGNTITNTKFDGIRINNDGGHTNATITNNDIDGSTAPVNNGEGITCRQDENGSMTILISGNDMTQISSNQIRIQGSDKTIDDNIVDVEATITNNTGNVAGAFGAGMLIDVGDGSGVAKNDVRINVSGNNVDGSETTPFFDFDITLNLNETSGASLRVTQASDAALSTANNGNSVSSFANPPNTITYNAGTPPLPPVPLLTAPWEVDLGLASANAVTQEQLNSIVVAARERWTATGLNARQIAAMQDLRFELGDLTGSYLGEASGNRIVVDHDAQGKGWFVDATPTDDVEFGNRTSATRRYTNPFTSAAGRIDLLTAIEHEIGHKLGLIDSYAEKDRDSIMYGYLTVGERRVPAKGQAANARAGSLTGTHFLKLKKAEGRKQKAEGRKHHALNSKLETRNSKRAAAAAPMSGETVTANIGTLPAGGSVTITFQATLNNPPALTGVPPATPQVSTQGTVTFTETGSPVLTDDPAVGGGADPTVTPVDLFDSQTTVNTSGSPSNQGDAVTFTATVIMHPSQIPTTATTPTGTVQFLDGATPLTCSEGGVNGERPLSGGTASCTTSSLSAGARTINANYGGDGSFDPSTDDVSQTVIACTTNPVVTKIADTDDGVCDADCSLREAINYVCSGTTITFDTAGVFATPQTITLGGTELGIVKNMTIDGPDAAGNHVTVSGNNASAVFSTAFGPTSVISDLTITGGASNGAVLVVGSTLTLTRSTLSANTFGGIFADNSSSVTVINSTISGNTAVGGGGGIVCDNSSTLNVTNSTISGNSTTGVGGGIFVTNSCTAVITNSTITNNVADSDNDGAGTGGGIFRGSGTVTLRNSIVALNFNEDGATDAADDIDGALVTGPGNSTHNLIGTCASCGLTDGVDNNELGVTAAELVLGALQNNGGPTQTHALGAGSIAVETGNNGYVTAPPFLNTTPINDQRGTGFPRIADSADANMTQTVDIGAYELHPTIEDITDKLTAEDTGFNFNFNLGDDTGALIASVTATSGNTTLIPNANLVVTGSGGTRNLAITPAADANSPADGTATITVTVTATNGQTAVDTFVVTVTEVNDNPDAVNDPLPAVDEDSATVVIPIATLLANDTEGPANESVQTLTLSLAGGTGNPLGGTVLINGPNVEFTLTPNFFGTASFDYTATDDGTTNGVSDPKSDTATASFTVNAVNDPPSFTIAANPPAVDEDPGAVTVNSFATSISSGPGESQTLTFNITQTGTTGNISFGSGPAIDSTTGNLTYTTNADTNGTATFDVTLSDNGSNTPPNSNTSGTQSFTITVNAVNDAPTFTLAGNPAAVNEDAGMQTVAGFASNFQPGPATATDETGQTLVGYTVTQTGGTLTFSTAPAIDTAGQLTYTAATNANGTATFDVVATDSGSGVAPNVNQSAPQSFTITVNAVNDEPSFTIGPNQSVPQNAGPQTVNNWATNISAGPPDEVQTVTFTVTVSGTTGTLTFDSAPAVDPTGTLTYTATNGTSGVATVDIFLTDSGSNVAPNDNVSPTQQFTITVSVDVSVHDATVAEPSSGTTNMLFTVVLNASAPAGGASVNYATANGGGNPATGGVACGPGVDYVNSNGTVSFATGEQVKTIAVAVCADTNSGETNETLLVNLSGAVNATIVDGQATGTITTANAAGAILISELRHSGPGGATDEFVEIYNNSDAPHTVDSADNTGYGIFKMGASCADAPVLVGTIPEGTVIPARGHYLLVGAQYSLSNYPSGNNGVVETTATGDTTLTADIEADRNVGLFSTTNLLNISSANRLDAVGFGANTGSNCDLLREGTNLQAALGNTTTNYSYFRKLCDFVNGVGCSTPGTPKDTNDNAADFWLADTQGTLFGATQRLGAPGPENLTSPIKRDPQVNLLLLDSSVPGSSVPNRFRNGAPGDPMTSQFGTMSIRRRVVNNTGSAVTRLRFRAVEITTHLAPSGIADLRALTSGGIIVSGVNDAATCTSSGQPAPPPPCAVSVRGTTLEVPPTQAAGGGWNSTLSDGLVTLATPLPAGQSINVQFLLGVQQTGTFRFLIIVEALP